MGKVKNIMAYTNPVAIAMGIPFVIGLFLGVLGFRVSEDAKETAKMTKEMLEK